MELRFNKKPVITGNSSGPKNIKWTIILNSDTEHLLFSVHMRMGKI
jgi:hypothetical protein